MYNIVFLVIKIRCLKHVEDNYTSPITDSINSDNNKHINTSITNQITYLLNNFRRPFTKMSWQCASTHEIEKIIKSLRTKIHVDMMKSLIRL